jgi:ParB-like nuclease domain
MTPDPDYVTVRRLANTPFGVLPADLVAEVPAGYDLDLVRSVAHEGLTTPITVRPLPNGRFKVVDGLKRLAVIRMLIRINKVTYDTLRGVMRPARQVFALIHCRIQPPSKTHSRVPTSVPRLYAPSNLDNERRENTQ